MAKLHHLTVTNGLLTDMTKNKQNLFTHCVMITLKIIVLLLNQQSMQSSHLAVKIEQMYVVIAKLESEMILCGKGE